MARRAARLTEVVVVLHRADEWEDEPRHRFGSSSSDTCGEAEQECGEKSSGCRPVAEHVLRVALEGPESNTASRLHRCFEAAG
jgi:hypothetical protein